MRNSFRDTMQGGNRAQAAGILLAAGEGKRMGRPKAICRAGGMTLLERMVRSLRRGGCRPVLAVTREELLGRLTAGRRTGGARLLANHHPELGQIFSLRLALQQLRDCPAVVVALVDQGELQAETVSALVRALRRAPAAVAAFCGKAGHPLAFRRSLYQDLLSPLADLGARAVVEKLRTDGKLATVDTGDPGVVRNINTPAQLEDFRRWLRRR